MSQNVTLNGSTHTLPGVGDEGWGDAVTNFLVAVASHCLQKTGGNFTLTADLNLGASYGVLAAYLSTRSASPAQSGLVRVANNEVFAAARNAAGSADLGLKVSASDRLQFNGVNVPTISSTDTLTNKELTAPVITSPAISGGTLASCAISGGTLASCTVTNITLRDSDVSFVDESDATKALKFQLSGITTATTRTVTVPDASGTLRLTTVAAGQKASATNDSASAGDIGEFKSQSRIESARGNVATDTSANVTNNPLSLEAGDWKIDSTVVFYSNSNAITKLTAAISKTSATLPAADTNGVPTSGEVMLIWDMPSTSPGAAGKMYIHLPRVRASVGSTTSFYLVCRATYSGGSTLEFYGSMQAERTR